MNHYPIEIYSINIAPEHKVFGKGSEDLSGSDLKSLKTANLIADAGIEGDRFCKQRPDYNGHVTFFSLEAWEEIVKALGLSERVSPEVTRRNIIVSGVDLKSLYGEAFIIQDIHFIGTVHCAPCLAMNRAFGEGAREIMRSRGGLRAQVKTSGSLTVGPSELLAEAEFDPENAGLQPPLAKLP